MNPHPVIPAHYARPEDKPAFVQQLFDAGAEHYDAVVDWGFLRSGAFYRRWAQQRHGLRPGMQLLDVACGTGLMTVAAARILGSTATITGVDPSEGMLAVARRRLPARFVTGRAEALPFPDASFDFLTMGYALRHVTDLRTTFEEFRRVLRPGGRVLILEVTKPGNRAGAFLFRLYFQRVFPCLARLFTRSRDTGAMMLYFWETMDTCVPPEAVLQELQAAGLTQAARQRMLGLFSEYTAVKD
ncbi:MAG TPA: class I SAM-dependent methyltransferase [Opitutaceae bacterium]|nr:class I SAM-dependent methyltransferase [Opitutaceae bacterium]